MLLLFFSSTLTELAQEYISILNSNLNTQCLSLLLQMYSLGLPIKSHCLLVHKCVISQKYHVVKYTHWNYEDFVWSKEYFHTKKMSLSKSKGPHLLSKKWNQITRSRSVYTWSNNGQTPSWPLKVEGGFISIRSAPKQKPLHTHCFSSAAVICLTLCILHSAMLIFWRDNFSTISAPVANRKPLMGWTPGSCMPRQVKQWPNAGTEPVSPSNMAWSSRQPELWPTTWSLTLSGY